MFLRIAFFSLLLVPPLLSAQNLNYHQDPNWRVPFEASEKQNPLAEKPDLAAGGKKLFTRNCVECHGPSGQGLKKAANLTLAVVQDQSDGALFWKITNGNPDRGMPPFSRFPELQRWQLVLYMRTLKGTTRRSRRAAPSSHTPRSGRESREVETKDSRPFQAS